MSTRLDVGERLRRANPVPAGMQAEPRADALERIIASPRAHPTRARRRARIRKPVLVVLIAALFAAGIAVATTISVRYFDESATKPVPDSVQRALTNAAKHLSPVGHLELDQTISAYSFASGDGNGQVYVTPYAGQPGFCAALVLIGKPVHAACTTGARTAAATMSINGGLQQWSLALTPTMHALLGRLAPKAAGDRVEIMFEDGTTENVPTHGPWFAYAVVGQRTQRGHRPTRIRVLDGHRVTTRFAFNPVSFNTLAEARALVPAGDGSQGQRAVRRWLLQLLVSPMFGDGGLVASHVDLAATVHIATLHKESGARVDVYGAPVRRIQGWPGTGYLLLGLVPRTGQLPFFQISASAPVRSTFRRPAGCRCMRNGYVLLNGQVPRGVTRVFIRTRDGRDLPSRLFAYGREWAWVGRGEGRATPVALVGRDASGSVVTTRKLLPSIF